MAELPTALDLNDIPTQQTPRVPSPSVDLVKLAADLVNSSTTLFSTKRKHFRAYKCISGADLVDCVCKHLTVTRPRATDYCEQMRVKFLIFSFPDKKKAFRDDKNSYYAFRETSPRSGEFNESLQSSSEASFDPFNTSNNNNTVTTTPAPSLPPSSSSPVFPSNSITGGSPDEKARKNNKNPMIKVARASSWASLVDLPLSEVQLTPENDPNVLLSPSKIRPIVPATGNTTKRNENNNLAPKDEPERSRRGSMTSAWLGKDDKDKRKKRESKKFSRFVLSSLPDKLDGSNFNARSVTRIMAPGYTVSNYNNIGTLIVTDLTQNYLVSVNNKSGLVSVAYQYPFILSYHENHKLQIFDIRTEHVKYIYEDPKNYRKLSNNSLKRSESPGKSRKRPSVDRTSKRELVVEGADSGRERSATLSPLIEREISTKSLSKGRGALKMSSTEPTLIKTDSDLLGKSATGSAPSLPVKDHLVDMANPHASDKNKSALQSLQLSDNEIIEKNRANCLLFSDEKLMLLTCYQTFYRLLTWSVTREEVPFGLKSPRDNISDAGSYEDQSQMQSETQSNATSKEGKKKERKPRDHDFISMLSELDFFNLKESGKEKKEKERDRFEHSSSAEYESVINFERKHYLKSEASNILQPVDKLCKLASKNRLLIGSHHAWQLWNVSSSKLEKEAELKEEGTSFINLQINNECVAGATTDSIYIWFLAQVNDEPIIIRHNTIVTEMILDQKYIYYGDRNGTICIRRLSHLLVSPQTPSTMYYFNTTSESDLTSTSAANQEPVLVRASYYENKINVIQKRGANLFVGHESSKFTVWRVEDGSDADATGSGAGSLTTSNNSNSVGPGTGGNPSGPGINSPTIGTPSGSYTLTSPIDRARGLDLPLRVYLVKEYTTSGPVLDLTCDEESCYFLVRNKRKSAPIEASRVNYNGLGKKIKGDNVIMTGPVDTSAKNKNKKDKLQAVTTRLDLVEKTNDDILSNLDRLEKSDRERALKLENELHAWGEAINTKLETQLTVLNRLKPAFEYVNQFQQVQQQLTELTGTRTETGNNLSAVSSPSTSIDLSTSNMSIAALIKNMNGEAVSGSNNSNTSGAQTSSEGPKLSPKPRDILSSFQRITSLFKRTVDEQAKEIETLKATVTELRDERQKQTHEIDELKNTVQLLVQCMQQQGHGLNIRFGADKSALEGEGEADQQRTTSDRPDRDDEKHHNDNASHTSALDHDGNELHQQHDDRSVVSAYSVFSDKRMARVLEDMAQMTDHSSQGSEHPNLDDVSDHHGPSGDVASVHEEDKHKERDDRSVASYPNDSVVPHDTTEELNERHLFLDELREEEEDENDESTWASKSVSTARSEVSNLFEFEADSVTYDTPVVSSYEGPALSLTPVDIFNTIRSEATLSEHVDLNNTAHFEQLFKTVVVPVNPPLTNRSRGRRIRTYSGSSYDSSSSMREISDSVTTSSMVSADNKQEDFSSMTTMVSREADDEHFREPAKEPETDAHEEFPTNNNVVRQVRHQDEEDEDSESSSSTSESGEKDPQN